MNETILAFRLLCEAYAAAAAKHFAQTSRAMGPLLTAYAAENPALVGSSGIQLIGNDEARKGAMWIGCFGGDEGWQEAKDVIRGVLKASSAELEDLFKQIDGGTLGDPEVTVAVIKSLAVALKAA